MAINAQPDHLRAPSLWGRVSTWAPTKYQKSMNNDYTHHLRESLISVVILEATKETA